ncbi:hypothetical protein Ppa06_06520 [Planomonospora parontospora subsp. parontospora]|uniref:WD40 repeat domain-containing protein n=2 Tax=Planomonospora parontospora TaxID=58119 RepID=A0AA37F2K6_9ACTN|nr:hypothetical protein [Planomonospora parontospora]GGK52555.1 hypothetical protein GCM10010126_10090 [Planomonospora parontospora]GII06854.1 hypothetical protein Ppa06_06520 [Planomonospora parontospora subsp. parontospora]
MKHRALAAGAVLTALAVSTATAAALAGPAQAVPARSTSAQAESAQVVSEQAVPARSAPAQAAPAPLTGGGVYLGYGSGVRLVTESGRALWTDRSGYGQFSVSPDGRKVAWIDGRGRLHVSAAGSGKASDKVVARGAAAGGPCLTPAWSADSRRIAFPLAGQADRLTVAVVGADGRGLDKVGATLGVCHLTWSADGRTLAGYAGTTEGVHLLDTASRTSRRVPGIRLANHVAGLSPDGRRVVVHAIGPDDAAGDGSWPTEFTPSVYDTRTGKKIALPVRGRLIGALYLRDGRLAVRVAGRTANTLVVLSPSGKRLQTLSEKPRNRRLGLLQAR